MIVFGLISSLFDFLTFAVLRIGFDADALSLPQRLVPGIGGDPSSRSCSSCARAGLLPQQAQCSLLLGSSMRARTHNPGASRIARSPARLGFVGPVPGAARGADERHGRLRHRNRNRQVWVLPAHPERGLTLVK